MKSLLITASAVCLLVSVWLPGVLAVDAPGMDRYRTIIERKPFGEPPPVPVNTYRPPPIKPSESFARAMRLTMIVRDEESGEIRVGIWDQQAKKSMTLTEGESEYGIKLVEADYDEEEAVLQKGTEMAILNLASQEIQPLNTAQQQRFQGGQRPTGRPSRPIPGNPTFRPPNIEPPPKPKYSGEELRQHLQNYQMEVIRKGLPPLPIPLTEDQDAQLVQEGILPPAP